ESTWQLCPVARRDVERGGWSVGRTKMKNGGIVLLCVVGLSRIIAELIQLFGKLGAFSRCAAMCYHNPASIVLAALGNHHPLGISLLSHDGCEFTQQEFA